MQRLHRGLRASGCAFHTWRTFMSRRSPPPQSNRLLTTRQVAQRLQVSTKQVRSLIHRRGLPCVVLGREFRVSSVSLDRWLRQAETTTGHEVAVQPQSFHTTKKKRIL
ncbi:MAG: helix-turn-helix domain-containing protein [Myxococcota bacterium]